MTQPISPSSVSHSWLTRLKNSGYRMSQSRRAIAEVLASTQRALTAVEIFDLARAFHPSLGLVSVYRTLERLEQLHLIQRVHQPDGCHAYLPAFSGHVHLLLCRCCGKAQFFAGDDLSTLISRVEQESGFRVNDHWLQLFGVCSKCQSNL